MKIRFLLFTTIILLFITTSGPAAIAQDGSDHYWPTVFRQDTSGDKYVALSFDDVPMDGCEELLGILDDLNVKATFYVCGMYIDQSPYVLQAIAEAGHEIGNHTYSHPDMTSVDDHQLIEELVRTNELVRAWTGIIPHTFRPPGGAYDARVLDAAYGHQMTTALWTVTCGDYLEPSVSHIVNTVLNRTCPGGIILLHDGIANTREAIPEIVNSLRADGYTIITVAEMIEMNYGPCPWPVFDPESNLDGDTDYFL